MSVIMVLAETVAVAFEIVLTSEDTTTWTTDTETITHNRLTIP